MGQNDLSQSDRRIFKSTIFPEQTNEIAWVFDWVWPIYSWESKIDCTWRINVWNKLIFTCQWKLRKVKSYFNDFWVGLAENRHDQLLHETLKSAQWVYKFSLYLHADSNAITFGYTNIILKNVKELWLLNVKKSLFVRPLAVAGRDLWIRVWPYFPPNICVGVFSWNWIIRFLWIMACARDPYEVVHDSPIFLGKLFLPKKIGKCTKNRVFLI